MAVLSDPISDFLTRFKNCCRAGNEEFNAPFSRIKADIAKVLDISVPAVKSRLHRARLFLRGELSKYFAREKNVH